jgi:hypothetical protein
MLVRVRQRFADDEVRRELDLLRQLDGSDVECHRRLARGRERLQRAGKPAVGKRHRMQPAGEVPQLGNPTCDSF